MMDIKQDAIHSIEIDKEREREKGWVIKKDEAV